MASIYQSIEILSKEKGIDAQIVVDAVKDAILVAARKQFRGNEELIAEFDEKSGALLLFAVKNVVEAVADPSKEMSLEEARRTQADAEIGSILRFGRPTEALGRIAAQTARQVILQKVREAERENIFLEYSHRVGELVNTTVKRIEGLDLVVDLGKTEARLSKKEQSRLESFSVGDRVRCIIKTVERTGKNAGVNVSRAAPELVMRLFEQEVPEIYDGTVVIRACAREAGERTKIAVLSKDRDVDCVGACVGMKGMRVQSIIRELRGEKIDIIEYNEDAQKFVEKALSPARISRVAIVDPEGKHMEVIVEDAQLSLAIGKKGQNVRLAAKLIGWRVDIKTEEEKRQEVEATLVQLGSGTPLSNLIDHGLSVEIYEVLVAGGIGTVEKVASMTPEELELIAGVTSDSVAQLGMAVNSFYGPIPAETPVEALAEELAVEPVEAPVDESAEPVLDPIQELAGVEVSVGETSPESLSPQVEPVQEAVVEPPAGEAAVSPGLESDTIENSGLPRAGSSEN